MVIQGVSYPSDFEAKKAIIAAASALAARGSMAAGDGSLSVRVGPNAVWITVDAADKAALTQDQLVRVDLNGRQMAASRPHPLGDDLAAHMRIYRENDTIQAIIHAYPVCAAVLSLKGTGVEAENYTPAVRRMGRIRLLPQQDPQSRAEALAAISHTDKGALLCSDGCMVWGRTLNEAIQTIDTLDYVCRVREALSGGKCSTCSGSCRSEKKPACSGNCAVCPDAQSCTVSPAAAVPAVGMTGIIRPGEALPPLPDAAAPSAPAPAPIAAVSLPAAVPAQKTAAVDVPKADVMAEVVRRVMGV